MTEIDRKMKVTGLPLPQRAVVMGITGMIHTAEGWRATFEKYGQVSFVLPQPISDWILAGEPTHA